MRAEAVRLAILERIDKLAKRLGGRYRAYRAIENAARGKVRANGVQKMCCKEFVPTTDYLDWVADALDALDIEADADKAA